MSLSCRYFVIILSLTIPPCSQIKAMDSVDESSQLEFKGVIRQISQMDIAIDIHADQLERARAASLSPENSELEGKLDELLSIFDDVTKIEDEQYLKMVMDILVRSRGEETFKQVSPYLSNKLRNSYQSIRELTQLRKRSSLKKLMKTLITESIEEAFTIQRGRFEDLEITKADHIRKYRYGLAASIVTGAAGCLATFFATYFAH